MGRIGAITAGKGAIPIYEQFRGIKHTCVDVDAAVEQIPNTNLSYRKAILIQNKHASQVLYIGGGIPYIIKGDHVDIHPDHDKRGLQWFKSSTGGSTNEWFLADTDKANPSLTQATYLYYATVGGSETLATLGTVGTLAAEHTWGWGTSADISGNTIFIRTNGSTAANSPKVRYESIHAYYFTLTADDTAATGGIEIAAGNAIGMTVDGSVRIFGIGSGADTRTGILEYY